MKSAIGTLVTVTVAIIGAGWLHDIWHAYPLEMAGYTILMICIGLITGFRLQKWKSGAEQRHIPKASMLSMGLSKKEKAMVKLLRNVGSIDNPNQNELDVLEELDRRHMLDISEYPNTGAIEYRLKEQFRK